MRSYSTGPLSDAPKRRRPRDVYNTRAQRKANPAHLLARRPDGIFVAPFELGEIGPDLFHAARQMVLEGLVSKRQDRPYWAGRSKHWIEFKNRKHSPMSRVMETKWWAAQKKSASRGCAPAANCGDVTF